MSRADQADDIRRAWEQGRAAGPGGGPAPPGVDPSVAALVSTSGTTGSPRLVELTWTGLHASARAVHAALGIDSGRDRWLCCLPPSGVAGLAIVARSWVSSTPLTVHERFDVDAVASAPAREGVTVVSLVATQLVRLLDAAAALGGYRAILLGGGPVPAGLVERAGAAGSRVQPTYGMTETWGGCVHDGRPLDGVEVRLGAGDEIEVRGPCVMRGYHGDPAATAAALSADGWLRTGDVGAFEPDGRLQIVDRLKDLVITGGVNVSPLAVERAIATHPGVADVCVVGVPDREWGERVVAVVVARDSSAPPTLAELRAFAGDRLTAPELPRELRFVARIPRTEHGKPLRHKVFGP